MLPAPRRDAYAIGIDNSEGVGETPPPRVDRPICSASLVKLIREAGVGLFGGEKMSKQPKPFVREYGPARQALEAYDCPSCAAKAGEACVGRPNSQWPAGYPWPKSKVHTARLRLLPE